jgi:hypothetical protein
MSNLRPQVRAAIQNFLQSQEDHHTAVDVLRVIEEEANLMKETQDVHDVLDSDPMEEFQEIRPKVERLKKLMQVTSCSRVRAGFDHSAIYAVVRLEKCQNLQLTFKYERKPWKESPKGCHVFYSIELSHNYGEREQLLEVQVWAPAGVPSGEPAVCVQQALFGGQEDDDDDEEDGSSDIDENENAPVVVSDDAPSDTPTAKKKQKTSDSPPASDSNVDDDEKEETHDSYVAQMDPNVLHNFMESAGLQPMTEATAFFLLMSFPYYEHEWDLIGYVLDQVFGGDSDDEMSDGGATK